MTSFSIREPIANPAYALPERPIRDLRHLPGPSARWLVGCSGEFIKDNAGCIARLAREFGPIFRLPALLGSGSVVMLGADANRLVLGNADENFSSHGGYARFPIFGKAVVTRDFQDHRELRKLIAGSFTVQSMRGYFEEISHLTAEAVASLADVDHTKVEMYPLAKNLALRIAARVFAGLDLGADQTRMNEALKAALDHHKFDAAFGGARRDEEKSRAKERVFSFRDKMHQWEPRAQRPELWNLYNARIRNGESIRVFPLSNWTELDVWQYIHLEKIPIVPLYFAAERPVVDRDGMLLLVDDDRMRLFDGEQIEIRRVRFRTLGCYPLTGAIESDADDLSSIVLELLKSRTSERQGRAIDSDSSGSMEKKKQEGYF